MDTSKKLTKILAFTGWTQDKMSDLMDINYSTFRSWVKGDNEPREKQAKEIDRIYEEMVEPYVCELEKKADDLERRILRRKIRNLSDDNTCKL